MNANPQENIVFLDPKHLKIGQKVKFSNDRIWFTVQARNERFIICNAVTKKNIFHTIIDLEKSIRGDSNLVFHNGYDNKQECIDRLKDFITGKIEVSHRNHVPLEIKEIKLADTLFAVLNDHSGDISIECERQAGILSSCTYKFGSHVASIERGIGYTRNPEGKGWDQEIRYWLTLDNQRAYLENTGKDFWFLFGWFHSRHTEIKSHHMYMEKNGQDVDSFYRMSKALTHDISSRPKSALIQFNRNYVIETIESITCSTDVLGENKDILFELDDQQAIATKFFDVFTFSYNGVIEQICEEDFQMLLKLAMDHGTIVGTAEETFPC